MNNLQFKMLANEQDWLRSFPVMHELRTNLTEELYLSYLQEMIPQGYRLMSLEDDGQIVSVAGIIKLTNLYYGRHIWVYDLATSGALRSQGYGLILLNNIETIAREEDCCAIALSSGLAREDAHRFYLNKAGFKKVSYVFHKSL